MPDWKKKNYPSGPMTDAEKEKEEKRRKESPESFQKLVSNTPTVPSEDPKTQKTRILPESRSAKGSSSAETDQTVPAAPGDIDPRLINSLHTAAMKIEPSKKPVTSSLEDMNVLLKPLGFHCHRLLGSGGMGSVFLATDAKLQRQCAIKVLLPRLSGNQQFTQLFMKEAETVAKFIHPNIVQVYAIHVVQDIYFIVMEYVQGTTLRERIKREKTISEEETLRIMDQVTQALYLTHRRGILHRDIKPQNILMTPEGVPKVADFGLAISVREASMGAAAAGTPTYMAPEQARGETPTVASDVYSLGIVMYMTLTGKIPYRAKSVEEVMKEISAGNRIDIARVASNLNPAIIKIVRKALETIPARRFKDMDEFNAAVRNAWLSYQRRGLKPMLPRVKRAAWMYIAPPACLAAGILFGYLVHNPTAEKTSVTYENVFKPRVEHLKRSLGRIMDGTTDPGRQMKAASLLKLLDESVAEKNPDKLARNIGEAEFYVDSHEMKLTLLQLNKSGALDGELRSEAAALWDAIEKSDREAFYAHRTKFFKLLDAGG